MSGNEKQSRYCFVNPEGGTVAVKIIADTKLVSGANFKLFNASKDRLLDELKLSAENGSNAIRSFRTPPRDMSGTVLVWKILCCSNDPKVIAGRIDIQIFQDGNRCSLTLPIIHQFENLVPCTMNSPASASGSLVFMPKKPVV